MASGLTEATDLKVEDGTGLDTSNSYVDRSDAQFYANLRQTLELQRFLEADESNQVAALIIATQYVDQRWVYEGAISVEDAGAGDPQALQWPRGPAFDSRGIDVSDELPDQIIEATIEYAARAIDADGEAQSLLPDPGRPDPAGRFITKTEDVVGPLRELRQYSAGKATTKFTKYPIPDDIIRKSGLLATSGERAIRA